MCKLFVAVIIGVVFTTGLVAQDVTGRVVQAARASFAQMPVVRGVTQIEGQCGADGLAPAELTQWVSQDPFADIHWGCDPLMVGTRMGIGLAQRNEWFVRGQAGDLADCASGVFGAELLLAAVRR